MNTTTLPARYATFGVIAGALALLLAVLHFWAGPFSDGGTLEGGIANKISGVRDAALAALRGESGTSRNLLSSLDIDKTVRATAAVLAAIAMVLAAIGFSRGEKRRVVRSAAFLGGGALVFQFAVTALMGLLAVLLIGVVLSRIDIGCCGFE